MEEYYLTDNIRLINDKMEYRKSDTFVPVKKHNWHHILNEYGWSWKLVKEKLGEFDSVILEYE